MSSRDFSIPVLSALALSACGGLSGDWSLAEYDETDYPLETEVGDGDDALVSTRSLDMHVDKVGGALVGEFVFRVSYETDAGVGEESYTYDLTADKTDRGEYDILVDAVGVTLACEVDGRDELVCEDTEDAEWVFER